MEEERVSGLLDEVAAADISATIFSEMTQAEIETNLSSCSDTTEMNSQFYDSDDDTGFISNRRRKVYARRKKRKRDWYEMEYDSQLKLTREYFKELSTLNHNNKLQLISEFATARIDVFQKYLSLKTPSTATTASTISTTATANSNSSTFASNSSTSVANNSSTSAANNSSISAANSSTSITITSTASNAV